jgi:hypothetical protein
MNDSFSFAVKINLKDYRCLNYSFVYGGRRGKINILVSLVILIACGFSFRYVINSGVELNLYNVLLMLLPILFFAFIPLQIFFQSKASYKKDKFLSGEQKYLFSYHGFTVNIDSSNSEISWDKIFLARENKNYLFIFMSKNKAFILPKKGNIRHVVKIKKLLFDNLERNRLEIKKIGAIY